jgi:CubicO group peptidase (beta-lactamase class C family)
MGIQSLNDLMNGTTCLLRLGVTLLLGASTSLAVRAQTPFDDWAAEHGVLGYSVSAAPEQGNPISWVGGLRDVERNLPVEPHTAFRVASISKAATALGFFQLWANGQIDLDQDLNELLDDAQPSPIQHPDFPDVAITPRMLLSHTSGLRDGAGYGPFLNATYAAAAGPAIPSISSVLHPEGDHYTPDMWGSEPGTNFTYANINFGLLGTAMEAVTGERFDVWMRDATFAPLSLNASFNVSDLDDINDLAVLYRYVNGWVPQADDFQGEWPNPENLDGYAPGTNAARFAPQGGLRCSAPDLLKLVSEWTLLASGGTNAQLLPEPAVNQLRNEAWSFDGSNGNTYGGLFEAWGHGLHLDAFESTSYPAQGQTASAFGHPGEAYGLISGAYHVVGSDGCGWRFAYLINGMNPDPTLGEEGWYELENALHNVLGQWANSVCTQSNIAEPSPCANPSGLGTFTIKPGQILPEPFRRASCTWVDTAGRAIHTSAPSNTVAPQLPPGRYLLTEAGAVLGSIQLLPPFPTP